MGQRALRVGVLIALVAHGSAAPLTAAEYLSPGAYHADPHITCIDGGESAPELIVIGEPTIYSMPEHGPYQIVGWLPILMKSTKGPAGPQDFSDYVADSPVDESQIRWFVAGPEGRAAGEPEPIQFERLSGARFKVMVVFLWLDPAWSMVASDARLVEQYWNTAGFFAFPEPYCDFAAFDVIPIS